MQKPEKNQGDRDPRSLAIGVKVRVVNRGSSFCGEHGLIVSEEDAGPFVIFGVNFEPNPDERQRVFQLSENELEAVI